MIREMEGEITVRILEGRCVLGLFARLKRGKNIFIEVKRGLRKSIILHFISWLPSFSDITQEGLFRKNGSVSRQQELKNLLNSGADLNLDCGTYSPHDCASVLKSFLADLPEPLLTEAHYPIHCRIAGKVNTFYMSMSFLYPVLCGLMSNTTILFSYLLLITNATILISTEMLQSHMSNDQKAAIHSRQIKALRLLFLLLPPENYQLLHDLLILLHRVASHQKQNLMSAINLGTMFAPHILCPRKVGTRFGFQGICDLY